MICDLEATLLAFESGLRRMAALQVKIERLRPLTRRIDSDAPHHTLYERARMHLASYRHVTSRHAKEACLRQARIERDRAREERMCHVALRDVLAVQYRRIADSNERRITREFACVGHVALEEGSRYRKVLL